MRKQIAFLTAALNLFACGTAASAETIKLEPKDITTVTINNYGASAVQTTYSHSGDSALMVTGTSGNKIVEIRANIQVGDTLSFWEKGSTAYGDSILFDSTTKFYNEKGEQVYETNSTRQYIVKTGTDTEKERCLVEKVDETDNGWIKVQTKPYVFEKTGSAYLRLIGEPAGGVGGTWYLDDLVCTKSDGTIRFALDFEGGAYNREEVDSFYMQGLSANGSDGAITLSWRNPNAPITDIRVEHDGVDITDGAELDTTEKGLNIFTVDGLTNGESYTYTVIAAIGESEYKTTVTGVAGAWCEDNELTADGDNLEGWTVLAEGNAYGSVEFDTVSKLEGKKSLLVNMNSEESDAKIILRMDTSNLEVGKTYKVSYSSRKMANGTPDFIWTTAEKIFKVTESNSTIDFAVTGAYQNVWLDNVKVVEYNSATGEELGDDIAINGNFEAIPEYEITTEFTKKGKDVTKLTAGSHSIVSRVKNNSDEDGVKNQIFALLKKDGMLINAWQSESVVDEQDTKATKQSLDIVIPSLDKESEYELFIFNWDAIDTMKSMTPVITYTN